MAIPNLIDLVDLVAREHPIPWRHAHTGDAQTEDFIRLLAARAHAVNPAFGLNGKRGNPDDISDDVLNFKGEGAQFDPTRGNAPVAVIDVIQSAGWVPGFPEPSPAWNVLTDPHPAAWVQPAEVAAPHTTKLGCSFFWLLRGMRNYQPDLRAGLRWVREELGGDFVRGFVILGHDPAEGPDPWSRMGTRLDWPELPQLIADVTDLCFDVYGLQVHWVLAGRHYQLETPDRQDALVDLFAGAIRPRAHKVFLAEMANEYAVNGFVSHELRNMARRLRGQMPTGFPIALSSPNTLMGGNASESTVLAEIDKMYGGDSGANVMTFHATRPEPIWNAERLRRAGVTMRLVSGEPRGPLASAGGSVTDPAVLVGDYAGEIRGRADAYVYHPVPGIWGGRCDPAWPAENRYPTFDSIPHAAAIASALKAMRRTGSAPNLPPEGEEMLPGRDEMMREGQRLHEFYRATEGLQRPEGLWIHNAPDWEGIGAWLFDVYLKARSAGQSVEEARAAYVAAIRSSAEWQAKHPGETP